MARAKKYYVITTHNAEMSGYFIAGVGSTPEAAEAEADLRYERAGQLTGIYEQTHAVNAKTYSGAEAQGRFGHFEFSRMCQARKFAELEEEWRAFAEDE